MILSEKTRNVNYRRYGSHLCDCNSYKSPSWKGPKKWYRFMAPAGTRIPEKPPSYSSYLDGPCGTRHPGWLNGHHPKQPGQLVNRKVCFVYKYYNYRNNCCWSNSVKIRNCGKYFVYFLSDARPCSVRYCAENKQSCNNGNCPGMINH